MAWKEACLWGQPFSAGHGLQVSSRPVSNGAGARRGDGVGADAEAGRRANVPGPPGSQVPHIPVTPPGEELTAQPWQFPVPLLGRPCRAGLQAKSA